MNTRLRAGGPRFPISLALALSIAAAAGALVFTRTHVREGRYRLAELTAERDALSEELERLEIRAAKLSAPRRIEEEARKIGLIRPDPSRIVVLHDAAARAGSARPHPETRR